MTPVIVWVLMPPTVAAAQDAVEVDVLNGGMGRAVSILRGRWQTPIGLESPPLDGADLIERTNALGAVWRDARVESFEFTYRGGAREGLEAAARAWTNAGGPGDYVVEDHAGVLHLVPTTQHSGGGTVPYVPLSNLVVDLTDVNGKVSLDELWQDARTALEAASGMEIEDGLANTAIFGHPRALGAAQFHAVATGGTAIPVTLSHPKAPAGEVIDELLRIGGNGEAWRLDWVANGDGRMVPTLTADLVDPADEAFLNGGPIPPK